MRKGLYILLAILLLIVGCDTKTAIKTGEICVNVDGRSIDPISMETSYYSISVTSGNNVQRAPRVEEGSSPARFNVEEGEWTVVVDAYNDHGDRIGTGSETVTVVGGVSTTCNVSVKEIEGTGTIFVSLNVSTDEEAFYTWDLSINATNENGTVKIGSGIFNTTYSSPIKAELANGRYFIEIYDNYSEELITAPIPVRIVAGAMTLISGEYHYDINSGWNFFPTETDTFRPNESYHIVLESEEVPIDYDLNAKVECDYGFDSGYNCIWYLNGYQISSGQHLNINLSNQYYRDQTGIKADETYMLSVKVTDGDPGKDSENSVNTIYYDYKLIKILEKVGLPERIEITGLSGNADGSIPIISSNSSLYLNSSAVYNNEIDSSISGDWYINNVLVAQNTATLSLTNLNNYVGRNDVEFKYSINGYTKTYYAVCFYVIPEMEFKISLNDLKAGRHADISVEKISGNYDGDYDLQFYFYKNDILNSCSVKYYSNQYVDGYYPTEPGDYEVKYKVYYNGIGFEEEKELGEVTVDEPDKLLDSVYGNNIFQGGRASFIVKYYNDSSNVFRWYLDGEEIGNSNNNSSSLSIYGVAWEVGEHTIKAIDDNDNDNEYSYTFNVLAEKNAERFDLSVTNLGNYKYEIKVVPVNAVSGDFTYNSTVYCSGSNFQVFNLQNDETVILDRGNSNSDKDWFSYEIVTTYTKDGQDFTVANYGNYSSYYSSNEVSFDKFLYVGNENIIVDIKLEEGYKPDQYQYLFYLDGTLIDIDFEGDGEYLLPMVEEGMHQFEMKILWNSGDSNASYTTIFMHSKVGFVPMPANEVYLSVGANCPSIENENKSITYTEFGVGCSTLVLSNNDCCYFSIISASDTSSPVMMTIPCFYENEEVTGNIVFTVPDDEEPTVYTNVENRLEKVSGNSLLPDTLVRTQIEVDGQNGVYGDWSFIDLNLDHELLNSVIEKYGEYIGLPIKFDAEKGEDIDLSLKLSITEEWINAYLDLGVDVSMIDTSLAEDTTIHLEGKIEYEEENGYLSFMGSRYPIYLQVSEDGTVLLLHVAIPGCPEGTPFIVVPFTRVSSIYNPIDSISNSFNEPKRITIKGVEDSLALLCDKQFASNMLSNMMMPVSIDAENAIDAGKYSVTGDESIIDVLGEELLVVNGNLCFISENSMTILKEATMNGGFNFQSYDNYGVSYYSITKSEGAMTYNVSYEKQGMPYRNGTITLTKNEVEGIDVVQEFIGKYMEINDGNNPDDIYIEFDENGDVYYNFGIDFSYKVAHYGINDERIVFYADAADIADIMGQEVDGWGVKAGIVLPYDGEKDQITLIDDVFVQLYNVPVL